jgi:hypothetical protein
MIPGTKLANFPLVNVGNCVKCLKCVYSFVPVAYCSILQELIHPAQAGCSAAATFAL